MTITVKYKALTTKINSKVTHVSRDGVGKIATGLRAAELKVRIEVEERPFSLHQNVPTCPTGLIFNGHPTYFMGVRRKSVKLT